MQQMPDNKGMNALNIAETMQTLGLQAKHASAQMAKASAATKNKALLALARLLREQTEALQTDNAKDLVRAEANGLSAPMVDRRPRQWRAGRVAITAASMPVWDLVAA